MHLWNSEGMTGGASWSFQRLGGEGGGGGGGGVTILKLPIAGHGYFLE